MTVPFSIFVRLSPSVDVAGVRMGIVNAVSSLGILIGTPLGGAILRHGCWIVLQMFDGGTLLVSIFSVFASRISKTGWRFTSEL